MVEVREKIVGVTPTQKSLYEFILTFYKVYGVFPTYNEMALGQIDGKQVIKKRASKSVVHGILEGLARAGYVDLPRGKHRALAVYKSL